MVSSLKNQCLKYTYNNLIFYITENDLPVRLYNELNTMRNCCVSTDYIIAVKNNHVCCLERIHDILIKIPWDYTTMEIAAENGSVDCLKYLYENGCPINTDIYKYAEKGGHVACINYLRLIDMQPRV